MKTKLTLLYVEDEDGIRNQLSRFLKYFSTTIYTATNGKKGLELYKKHLPDIVISDIKMPIMNGIEMVKAIKEINQKQHIIFTTAHSESNYFMDAIDMQVDGYILKPIDLKKLEQKLKQIQELINLKKDYIKYQKELEYKAYTDNLTQIYNRRYFEDILDKEIKKYQIEKTPLSLILFDIDKFKNFNDTYGHQMGDEILKTLAKIIKENIKDIGTFARWGGEEFACILPNIKIDKAKELAKHLRNIIEKHIFINNLQVTCSFGVAEFCKNDVKRTIIKRTDDALYRAKKNGRNRVETE